jgi:DNA-binding LacI/PurR family transcriptional regulator
MPTQEVESERSAVTAGTAGAGRRVTSGDVARAAGVSRATVSYVLNDVPHQKIPEATRRRILDAAARLGYTPSAAARALRSGRSDVVLCLLPDWPIGPTVGELLVSLSSAFAAAGLTLVAHPRVHGDRPVSDLWKAITPAAVIAWEDIPDDEAAAMRSTGVELAVALLSRSGRGRREVGVPQQRAGRLQVEHLAAQGHRRLGYALPDDDRVVGFARPRLDGVRQACAELGLDEPVVRMVGLDGDAAARAVDVWRGVDPAVTAVCAYNDDIALAVLAGLRLRGLSAPADLAVIGVDDVPVAKLAAPPLTTVKTDLHAVADHLARTIVAALAGQPAPRRPGSDVVHLVVRDSA